jgi:hypothetical protein
MIARDGRAFAVRLGALLPWSFAGYGAPAPLPTDTIVKVLTPPSTVAALKGGYRPLWAEALKRFSLAPVTAGSCRVAELRASEAFQAFRLTFLQL